jgi:hypothetical protein
MDAQNAATQENGQVELQEMISGKPRLPIEDDIMQLARLGEIKSIQKLFDSGKFDSTYKDEQGITPLHVRLRHSHSDQIYAEPSFIVGCDQQPLRTMSLSHTVRG